MLVLAGVESLVVILGLMLPEVKGRSLDDIEAQYDEGEDAAASGRSERPTAAEK